MDEGHEDTPQISLPQLSKDATERTRDKRRKAETKLQKILSNNGAPLILVENQQKIENAFQDYAGERFDSRAEEFFDESKDKVSYEIILRKLKPQVIEGIVPSPRERTPEERSLDEIPTEYDGTILRERKPDGSRVPAGPELIARHAARNAPRGDWERFLPEGVYGRLFADKVRVALDQALEYRIADWLGKWDEEHAAPPQADQSSAPPKEATPPTPPAADPLSEPPTVTQPIVRTPITLPPPAVEIPTAEVLPPTPSDTSVFVGVDDQADEGPRGPGRPRSTPNLHPEVEPYLDRVSEVAPRRITIGDFCLVAIRRSRDDTYFASWRRGDGICPERHAKAFKRTLALPPEEFLERLGGLERHKRPPGA